MSDLLIAALMDDKGPWPEERQSGLFLSERSAAEPRARRCLLPSSRSSSSSSSSLQASAIGEGARPTPLKGRGLPWPAGGLPAPSQDGGGGRRLSSARPLVPVPVPAGPAPHLRPARELSRPCRWGERGRGGSRLPRRRRRRREEERQRRRRLPIFSF